MTSPFSCRSFVSSQSRTKVSAGITNVSGLAVAALDWVYCSLSLALTLVSSRRKVAIALWLAIVSKVSLMYGGRCRNRARDNITTLVCVFDRRYSECFV